MNNPHLSDFTADSTVDVAPGSIHGLRAFEVVKGKLAPVTYSAYAWKDGENVASCHLHETLRRRERAFHPSGPHKLHECSHGFWAYFGRDHEYRASCRASAIVEGYGETVLGEEGFRSEKARIKSISIPTKLPPEPRRIDKLLIVIDALFYITATISIANAALLPVVHFTALTAFWALVIAVTISSPVIRFLLKKITLDKLATYKHVRTVYSVARKRYGLSAGFQGMENASQSSSQERADIYALRSALASMIAGYYPSVKIYCSPLPHKDEEDMIADHNHLLRGSRREDLLAKITARLVAVNESANNATDDRENVYKCAWEYTALIVVGSRIHNEITLAAPLVDRTHWTVGRYTGLLGSSEIEEKRRELVLAPLDDATKDKLPALADYSFSLSAPCGTFWHSNCTESPTPTPTGKSAAKTLSLQVGNDCIIITSTECQHAQDTTPDIIRLPIGDYSSRIDHQRKMINDIADNILVWFVSGTLTRDNPVKQR